MIPNRPAPLRPLAVARFRALLALAAGLLLAAPVVHAGGFSVFDQGAKGAGLAGAFVAQADDASAVYYNPAGMAFFDGPAVAAGALARRFNDAQFQGLAPGLGAGETGDQQISIDLASQHAYWVQPMRPGLAFGLGLYTPFYLSNEWKDPGDFPGRTLSTAAEIQTYDANGALAFRLGKTLGIGLGVVVRGSEISNTRRIQRSDPDDPDGPPLDVASLVAETDLETAVGWNLGILHRPTCCVSWGLTYRSGIDVDHVGSAVLTQIPTGNDQLDDLIAGSLPFGDELALRTTLDYPAVAAAGVAFQVSPASLFELDVNHTEWSRVEGLAFALPNNPTLGQVVPLALDDALAVRLGFRYETRTGTQFRAGVAFEETPQPDATVSPFLADADRTTVALGWGKDWLDLALQWVQYDDRTVTTSFADLNGTWSTDSLRLAVTISLGSGGIPKIEAPKAPKLPEAPKLPKV